MIVIENGSPFSCGFIRLLHGLGYPQDNWYIDIERDILASGFRLEFIHDVVCTRDLSNPSEGVLRFIAEVLFEHMTVGPELIRERIAEIYSDPSPDVKHVVRKLAVFKNLSLIHI